MATRDYYNILGVERTATQDEIKRAYRALARQWHPDHNRTDQAERRFKDITEAYKTLSNVEERRRYDRLGPLYTQDGRPPRPDEVSEAVGAMFSGLFRQRRKARGEDLRYTISLTLEEVARGLEREITVPRQVQCSTCAGDGADPDSGHQSCKVCGGSGKATGPRLFRSSCYHCDGRGFTVSKACRTCEGNGRKPLNDTLKVKVPAGVATGQKLKLSGKGNAPPQPGVTGDLLVIINIADHPLFRRRGNDLMVDLPVSFPTLALGGTVEVPTLDGTTTIQIPAGSPPGKILRLAGRGLPAVSKSKRGDLHLQLRLELPTELTQAQRAELKRWSDTLQDTAHPDQSEFRKAMEERR